jgi:AcrR family transcriptional regulator
MDGQARTSTSTGLHGPDTARDATVHQPPGSASVLIDIAIDAFSTHGYHGTSMRDLARGSGVTVAALYHYFPSKHDILYFLVTRLMDQVLADVRRAQTPAEGDPNAQLVGVVQAHVHFHTSRQRETFIANTELRGLEGAARDHVIGLRDDVEAVFRQIVIDGLDTGEFRSAMHPYEITRAVIAMSMHIAQWYDRGALTAADIADRYAHLALDLVCYGGDVAEAIRRVHQLTRST